MDKNLMQIKEDIYDKCGLKLSNFQLEKESKDYGASQFQLNARNIVCRSAKITPKKVGQFVTLWKRNGNGPIEPFSDKDQIDFFVINVRTTDQFGQFVFPQSILIEKGVVSTAKKEGKRALRVYPSWDLARSRQAQQTQKWQLRYFYEIRPNVDPMSVKGLYG